MLKIFKQTVKQQSAIKLKFYQYTLNILKLSLFKSQFSTLKNTIVLNAFTFNFFLY